MADARKLHEIDTKHRSPQWLTPRWRCIRCREIGGWGSISNMNCPGQLPVKHPVEQIELWANG